MVIGVSVLACFLVPAPSLQMGDPASRGGKDWMRGLPQENYSLSISVVFHAFGLLVMLSVAERDASPLSEYLPICRDEILRTKAPEHQQPSTTI
jgi:hypothetical protein